MAAVELGILIALAGCLVGATASATLVFPLLAILLLGALTVGAWRRANPLPLVAVLPPAILFYTPLLTVGGLTLTFLDVLVVVIAGLVLWRVARPQRPRDPSAWWLVALSLLLALVAAIPSLYFGHSLGSLAGVLLLLKKWSLGSLILLGALGLRPEQARQLAIHLSGWLLAYFVLTYVFPHSYLFSRNVGFMFNPNVYGVFCALALNVALGLAMQSEPHTWRSTALGLLAVLACDGIITSGSRTAVLAGTGVLIYWLVVTRLNRRILVLLAAVAVLVAGIVAARPYVWFLDFGRDTAGRWSQVAGEGLYGLGARVRLQMIAVGLRMWWDHPLLGYGPTNLDSQAQPYLQSAPAVLRPFQTTDNQYTDLLVTVGLVGSAIFAAVLLLAWRVIRTRRADLSTADLLGHIHRANIVALALAGVGMPSFFTMFHSMFFWLVFLIAYVTQREAEVAARPVL